MAAINWTNVATSAGNSGSSANSALQGLAIGTKALNGLTANRRASAQEARTAKAFNLALADKAEVKGRKAHNLKREAADAAFRKAFFSDSKARLNTPSIQKALMGTKAWRKANPAQRKAAMAKYAESLNGKNIRTPKNFTKAYDARLRAEGLTNAEIDAEKARAIKEQYPTMSSASQKLLIDALPKTREVGGSLKGSAKRMTTVQENNIVNTLVSDYHLDGTKNTVLGSTALGQVLRDSRKPDGPELRKAAEFLNANGITDPNTIRSALTDIMTNSGTTRDGFDVTTKSGLDNILARASVIQSNSASSGTHKENIDQTKSIMNILGLGVPSATPDQTLVSGLVGALSPADVIANQSYIDNGGMLQKIIANTPQVYPQVSPSATQGQNLRLPQPTAQPTNDSSTGLLQGVGKATGSIAYDFMNPNEGTPKNLGSAISAKLDAYHNSNNENPPLAGISDFFSGLTAKARAYRARTDNQVPFVGPPVDVNSLGVLDRFSEQMRRNEEARKLQQQQ